MKSYKATYKKARKASEEYITKHLYDNSAYTRDSGLFEEFKTMLKKMTNKDINTLYMLVITQRGKNEKTNFNTV